MIPLSMILNIDESIKGAQLGNAKRLVNRLLFMDDLKLYARDENQLSSLVSVVEGYSRDIGMELEMDKCDDRRKKESEDGRYGAAVW